MVIVDTRKENVFSVYHFTISVHVSSKQYEKDAHHQNAKRGCAHGDTAVISTAPSGHRDKQLGLVLEQVMGF